MATEAVRSTDGARAMLALQNLAQVTRAMQGREITGAGTGAATDEARFVQDMFLGMRELLDRVTVSQRSRFDSLHFMSVTWKGLATAGSRIFTVISNPAIARMISSGADAYAATKPKTVVIQVKAASDEKVEESKGADADKTPPPEEKTSTATTLFAIAAVAGGIVMGVIGLRKKEAAEEAEDEALSAFVKCSGDYSTLPGTKKLSQAFYDLKDNLGFAQSAISDHIGERHGSKKFVTDLVSDIEYMTSKMEDTQTALQNIAKRSGQSAMGTIVGGCGLASWGGLTLLGSRTSGLNKNLRIFALVMTALGTIASFARAPRHGSRDQREVINMGKKMDRLATKWGSDETKAQFGALITAMKNARTTSTPPPPSAPRPRRTAGTPAGGTPLPRMPAVPSGTPTPRAARRRPAAAATRTALSSS